MAKPSLGFPTRTAAVLALHDDGLNVHQIAAQLETTACRVRSTLSVAQSRAEYTERSGKLVIPFAVAANLQIDAEIRGISVSRLAARLLETIVTDGLIDAVLDDAREVSSHG